MDSKTTTQQYKITKDTPAKAEQDFSKKNIKRVLKNITNKNKAKKGY